MASISGYRRNGKKTDVVYQVQNHQLDQAAESTESTDILNGIRRPSDLKITMVGTHLAGRGGVASVLRTWKQHGVFDRWQVNYVATNCEGSRLGKSAAALKAWLRCAAVMLSDRRVLVHVHTSSFISFWRKSPIFALAIALRRPLIVSLHGGAFQEFYRDRGAFGQAWIRLVMRRALRFVVLTQEWQRWVRSVEPLARVTIIPNPALEMPDLEAIDRDLERHTGESKEASLLFLGRIEVAKGIEVLLAALQRSWARGAPWRLVCGGTGEIESAIRFAARVGLPLDAVTFAGWVDGAEKRRLLQQCSLLVLPSLIENMPVVLLEAFAYGKPVIATRVGGIPDVVTDGVDGFLVPPNDVDALADSLVRAYRMQDDLPRLGRAGRNTVEKNFSPQRVIARLEAVYGECLGVSDPL